MFFQIPADSSVKKRVESRRIQEFDRLNSSMRPKSSSKAETEETDVLAFVAKNTFPAEDPTVATGERAGT